MSDDYAVREDYWSDLEDDLEDVPEGSRTTVLDRIVDQLEPERIHGIEIHGSNGRAYYGVVVYSGRQQGMDVLDLRTVVIDLRDETVRIHDNGLWIPRFEGAARALTSVVARACNDLEGSVDADAPPLRTSAIDADADRILSYEIDDGYEREDGDGWGSTWGNGQGEPPEAHGFRERLVEAGVPRSRFSRMEFGKKTPFERYANRDLDGLLGNYGVETGLPCTTEEADVDSRILEHDPLVVVDVDDPDRAPLEDLPETYRVSSPNGSDDRAHHYYRFEDLEDKQAVYDHFGSWAVKPGWGDVWLAGEYVVGPGCKTDDGTYDVVDDVPIERITADEMIEILEDGPDEIEEVDDVLEEITEPAEADVDEDDQEENDDERTVECHDCGADLDPGTARLADRDGSPVYVCPGGCE
ncbi:hypothetical protein GCM10010451_66260 [Streptomyces virens]|uniref:DNA primase/polymerase bifunctional N-terminal domain-containing protein n=2 Tax=Bacillati TaxID=1783272 RepID=A0ABP6HG77_9ACTN